jgi:hypothetical protein
MALGFWFLVSGFWLLVVGLALRCDLQMKKGTDVYILGSKRN